MQRTLLFASLLALVSTPAFAYDDYWGTRVLGMGGASRAFAIGDAGLLLNPSGMSLIKTYTVEGGYEYAHRFSENFLHASVVDATSSYNLAGGLYYTYHLASPPGLPSGHGHEVGGALSLPFGEILAIGATVKYDRFSGVDTGPGNHTGGVTFDIGATLKPTRSLSFAAVGMNLSDLQNGETPRGVGYGGAFIPIPNLLIALDGRTNFTPDNLTGRKGTSIMAGGDWTIAERIAVRLGGGHDAASGAGYLTAGLSGLTEIGALDVGFRQDISRPELAAGMNTRYQTVLGVSLRLFVPASQAAQPLPSF